MGPAAKPELPPHLQVGTIVSGRYRIDRLLGVGGMGILVVATQLVTEQLVAIKFMHIGKADRESRAAKRFAREAKAAAMLKSEHVVRVLDVATLESGEPYIVTEFLDGADLEQTVERRGPLPVQEAVDYIMQALEALAEAHLLGIVHRDLKPANLFVTRTRSRGSLLKVLDFGLVKLVGHSARGDSLTAASAVLGTPIYMSPEQIHGVKDIDRRVDIWAIGAVLYTLLEGRPPFTGDTVGDVLMRGLSTPPEPFAQRDVPEELRRVVLKCLEKTASRRFENVYDLAIQLRPFGTSESTAQLDRIARLHGQAHGSVRAPPEVASMPPGAGASAGSGAPAISEAVMTEAASTDPMAGPMSFEAGRAFATTEADVMSDVKRELVPRVVTMDPMTLSNAAAARSARAGRAYLGGGTDKTLAEPEESAPAIRPATGAGIPRRRGYVPMGLAALAIVAALLVVSIRAVRSDPTGVFRAPDPAPFANAPELTTPTPIPIPAHLAASGATNDPLPAPPTSATNDKPPATVSSAAPSTSAFPARKPAPVATHGDPSFLDRQH